MIGILNIYNIENTKEKTRQEKKTFYKYHSTDCIGFQMKYRCVI